MYVTPQSGTAVQWLLTGACRRKTARTTSYETAITVPVPGHSAGTHSDKYESLQILKINRGLNYLNLGCSSKQPENATDDANEETPTTTAAAEPTNKHPTPQATAGNQDETLIFTSLYLLFRAEELYIFI
jgi:hypothetical protein